MEDLGIDDMDKFIAEETLKEIGKGLKDLYDSLKDMWEGQTSKQGGSIRG